MRQCHGATARARPLVTAPYRAEGDRFVPLVRPAICPWNTDGASPCAITAHDWRERKSGPGFPILVLRCDAHGHGFTLYPLGHVPYGRTAIAPVNCEGELLRGATANDNVEVKRGRVAWATTVFGAALDAAGGSAWPRELCYEQATGPTWFTQTSRLVKGAQILGIAPAPTPRVGETIATTLAIPRLAWRDAERAWPRASGYRERGKLLVSLLQRLPRGRRVVDRLLESGALAGAWGVVTRWDERGAHRFPSSGTGFG